MGPSQLSTAAGACFLAAALLTGSAWGGVAVADPDSSGAAGSADQSTSNSGSTGRSPSGGAAGTTAKNTTQGTTGAPSPGQRPGPKLTIGPISPTDTTPLAGVAKLLSGVPNLISAVPRALAAAIGPVAPVTSSASAVSGSASPAARTTTLATTPTTTPVPVVDTVAPIARAVGAATGQVSPTPIPLNSTVGTVFDVSTPVNSVVTSVTNLIFLPVNDVIGTVEQVLTSVGGAVGPFVPLLTDLPGLLGVGTGVPGVPGVAHAAGTGPSTAAYAPAATQLPLALPTDAVPRSSASAINATGVATVEGITASTLGATTHVGAATWLPGAAESLASHGTIQMDGVRSFFPHGFGQLLLTVSLTALALAALPGAGGLALFTAVGVRLGYRQAKTGFAIRSAGFARFAHSGPLGIVRSGSFVAIRPKPTRVVRPTTLRVVQLLEDVA